MALARVKLRPAGGYAGGDVLEIPPRVARILVGRRLADWHKGEQPDIPEVDLDGAEFPTPEKAFRWLAELLTSSPLEEEDADSLNAAEDALNAICVWGGLIPEGANSESGIVIVPFDQFSELKEKAERLDGLAALLQEAEAPVMLSLPALALVQEEPGVVVLSGEAYADLLDAAKAAGSDEPADAPAPDPALPSDGTPNDESAAPNSTSAEPAATPEAKQPKASKPKANDKKG